MKSKSVGFLVCTLMILAVTTPSILSNDFEKSSTFGEILDQSQEFSDDCISVNDFEWQEFVPTLDNLARAELKILQWNQNSPNIKLTIEKPLGNVLTQKELPANVIPDNCDWVSFDIPDIALTPGTKYHIKLTAPTGSEYGWGIAWNNLYLPGDSSKPPGDWCFRTYGEEVGNQPPAVTITYPKNGDTVRGFVNIAGESHDLDGDAEIQWVKVKIDNDNWFEANDTNYWNYDWDSKKVLDESHTVSAKAYDGIAESNIVSVQFNVINEGPEKAPDLIVTDVWEENGLICYQVRNIGNDTAPSGTYTALLIDNDPQVYDIVGEDLDPGERYNSCFNYNWDCSTLEVAISVSADYEDDIFELDETNNNREELWKCDTTPPKIILGPIVHEITQSSALIYWKTDEDCDGVVKFDSLAGLYGHVEEDTEIGKNHNVKLSGLKADTTYHFIVESRDVSGNDVKSKDYNFITSSQTDNQKPSISLLLPDILTGLVDIPVDAHDNIGVDRVVFYCDGEQKYTDYTTPYSWRGNTFVLVDGEHDISARGFDGSDNMGEDILTGDVRNCFPPEYTPLWVEFNEPISNPLDPTEVYGCVGISASVYSINHTCIEFVNLSINDVQVHSESFSTSCRYYDRCEEYHPSGECGAPPSRTIFYGWNTIDLSDGLYEITVDACDNVGPVRNRVSKSMVLRRVDVPYEELDLRVYRHIIPHDNYLEVQIDIHNEGPYPVYNLVIKDDVKGFNVVYDPDLKIEANSFENGPTEVDITKEITEIHPSGVSSFTYYLVPILFSKTVQRKYQVGLRTMRISYEDESGTSYENEYYCSYEEYSVDRLSNLFENADYLIAYKPFALFNDVPGTDVEVNQLISVLAELAMLKNGVFGYVPSNEPGASFINSQVNIGGYYYDMLSSSGTNPLGYLLLVGEEECITSYSQRFWLDWSGDGEPVGYMRVRHSDQPISNIGGGGDPDIAVGRIIGNYITAMIAPVQASIGVYKHTSGYDFDRSNALLVSGTGEGKGGFKNNVNNIEDELASRGTNVYKIHWQDQSSNTERLNLFKANTAGQDIIYFSGHGNVNFWSPALSNGNFPLDFGSTNPFVFAPSCLTGKYEGGGEYSIAERFFINGAAVYIGATQVSPVEKNTKAGVWFFDHWDNTDYIGDTFLALERNKRKDNELGYDWWRLWVYEYNLYGDPKFGSVPPAANEISENSEFCDDISSLKAPPSTYDVTVPDYVVNTEDGIDYVEIPNGDILCAEEGRPQLPYLIESIEIPEGYRIQNVVLDDRFGMETSFGMTLPMVEITPEPIEPIEMKEGLYPELDFEWMVEENIDETSTLEICIYPFYYSPATTQVKFYKNYVFEIDFVSTDVSIISLYTDKAIYSAGDLMDIELWLDNKGQTKDIIASVTIRDYITDEVVESVLLRTLKDCKGVCSCASSWDTSNAELDMYNIEVTVTDASGNLLDKKIKTFWFETPYIRIDSISGGFGASAIIENSGSVNADDIDWSISLDGLILMGDSQEGTIESLVAGERKTVSTGLILGLGEVTITVNADDISKTASGFLIGPFVLGIK